MKKLLGILVLGLLWCNTSFANIDDLDIPITKAEFETEVIKANKEYRQSCEGDFTIEGYDIAVKFISYVDVAGKKQTLINEFIMDLGDDGKVIFKTEEKIKLDGKLSKPKTKSEYIPGTVEYSKKEIKQVKKMLKYMAELVSFRAINYGEKATPGINHESGKKELSKMLKKMGKYMFPGEDPKEVKEFLNIIKKDVKFELVKDYLGTTELNGEKFYALRWGGILKYIGDIPELKEPLEAMSTEVIHFIHVPSGYRSAVKVLISSDEDSAEMMEDIVCTIYKNDQMLTEVSISELEDITVAEKVETKEKPEKKEKKVVKMKKEPSQTQEVVKIIKNLIFCDDAGYRDVFLKDVKTNMKPKGSCPLGFREISYNQFKKPNQKLCYNSTRTDSAKISTSFNSCNARGAVQIKYDGKQFYYMGIQDETQIAKTEPSQTDDSSNVVQQLKELKQLLNDGVITEEEFTKAKKKLLD